MRDARDRAPVVGTLLLTTLAMLAFAANSLLCRLALRQDLIDPASFAGVRVVSGALALAAIVRYRGAAWPGRADWTAAAMLFAYLGCFSFAYLTLPAGTGALILFGAVQLTMLGAGLRAGERLAPLAWCGVVLAAAGLVWLMLPSVAAPSPGSAALMAAAGAAWGIYSLRGRGVADPLAATAANFARAVPLTMLLLPLPLLLGLPNYGGLHADPAGVLLAVVSGAVTSGIGYVLWYAALAHLSSLRAAAVQLSVPLIAALGGVLFMAEAFTARLAVAGVAILGGIAMVLRARERQRRQ
jgi:drug/metabolite transporter (DMT)-like permease